LQFGREDDDYIEVISGLKPGTEYATANSFVLKADVLKSGASHAH
jgi:cobalt-zinc-cadmium efflux system membrane fusion protein